MKPLPWPPSAPHSFVCVPYTWLLMVPDPDTYCDPVPVLVQYLHPVPGYLIFAPLDPDPSCGSLLSLVSTFLPCLAVLPLCLYILQFS